MLTSFLKTADPILDFWRRALSGTSTPRTNRGSGS